MRDTIIKILKNLLSRRERRVYLDYAAATPIRKEVLAVMQPYFSEFYGNPSAIHKEGVITRNAINTARNKVARCLEIRESGVVFTGSGTESNNLAIFGYLKKLHKGGLSYTDMEVITTELEHPSVLEVMNELVSLGVLVHYVEVNEEGLIVKKSLEALLGEKTVLVTFAYVNSEIGTIQDVRSLVRVVRKFEKENGVKIPVHLDAAQAPLWLPCQLEGLGVDMLTLDAGKCYGPKGVGILAMRNTISLASHIRGGGQEFGLRAGTENTPLIIGCAEAVVIAQAGWKLRSETAVSLRDFMFDELNNKISGILVNGPAGNNMNERRAGNNINISIPGIDTEFATIVLDSKGISVSTKSACSGASGEGSNVVKTISGDAARATSTLRFTLGEETTRHDIERTVFELKKHVEKTREFNRTI